MKITLNDDFNNCLFLHFLNLSFISLVTYVYHSENNIEHTCIIFKNFAIAKLLTYITYACVVPFMLKLAITWTHLMSGKQIIGHSLQVLREL